MVFRLLNHLTKIDVDKGNNGALDRDDLAEAFKEYFPGRDQDSILTLINAAETELDAKELVLLDYKALFGVVCIIG